MINGRLEEDETGDVKLCSTNVLPLRDCPANMSHKTKSNADTNKKNKLNGLSPQANYTDRATAACRRI
jgi:hypothetical protein